MAVEADNYFHAVKTQSNNVVVAYVTFRSMEGARRVINYSKSFHLNTESFLGSKLKFDRAISPDLIRWENLSVSKVKRLLLTLLIYFVTFCFLVGVIVLIMAVESY